MSLFNLGWRGKKGYWTIGINERVQSNVALPSAIFNMMDNGLAPGTTLNFANMRVNAKVFHEISVGYSRNVTEQLTVGGRFKYLSGIGAVKTDFQKFELTTGRDVWNLEADGGVYTSLPMIEMQENEDGTVNFDSIATKELETKDIVNLVIPFVHNPGVAIDFGFNFKINENFSFSAAVNDLGFIAWTNELNSIKVKGGYQFEGLQMNVSDIKDIDYEEALDNMLDSIKSCMSPTLSRDVFTTGLNPNIYIGELNGEPAVARKMTPRECLNLMGFDHDFKIVVDDKEAYRQAGNSIVVPVLKKLIESLKPYLGSLIQ